MAKIISQFAHVFIHYYSNKTSSACKLFISEPTQNQERLLGRLFGVLEVNTPSRENSQLINQIIGNLEEAYYSQAENEDLDFTACLENSLREVNQRFNEMIRNRQITLVGNLNEQTIKEKINLGIGVLKDNQLFLSYLNNINIYLIHKTKQDYKIIDIKRVAQEENNNESNQALNLFANIISGELNPPDFLILANGSFLNYITLERIQKIVTSLPIHKAAEYFKNSLLQFEGYNFASIIIKNTSNQIEESKEPASLTSITELNFTESTTEKLLAPSLLNIIKNSLAKIYTALKHTFASKKVDIKNEKSNADLAEDQMPPLTKEIKSTSTADDAWDNYFQSIKKSLRNIGQKFSDSQMIANIRTFLRLKSAYFGHLLRKIPNFSKFLLLFAGILIILFIFSVTYFQQKQGQNISQKEFQDLITQIQGKKNQSESDLIYGDEAKARISIGEAQTLLATLPIDSKKQKEIHDSLNKDLMTVIAKLRKITIINDPLLIADLSAQQENNIDIQNIILSNNNIFAFDSLNNSSYTINLESREIQKNLTNLNDIGKIIKTRKIADKILIYHDKNGFVELKDNKYSPVSVALNPQAIIADFADYNSRLYVLDIGNNQIVRQPQADNGYGAGINWFKTAQDIKDIIALSIDTNIWLLDKKGAVLKFTKGNKQAFELKNVEPVLEAPTKLFTNDQTNFIYILEPKNKRIVVIDKSGNLIIQYYSDTFNNPQDFAVLESEKKIFVSSDNKIYFFNLTHLK
ncbi:MAG: hypothetical protein NTX82_00990 [Candidatus Parcubacteria bacterium]|nr:hypothetical protein [Candidatus Parcubacteria bacterium]